MILTLVEIVVKLLVLVSFAVGIFSCLPVLDRVMGYVEPLYLKCLVYSGLRYVHGDNPSGTVTISVINDEIRLRCVPSNKDRKVVTVALVPKGSVRIVSDGGPITLSSVNVMNAGSILSDEWVVSFPPVVLRMNIKR
ncbi:hypothetical protein [Thermotoga sp. Ku-13t]|uniref:hypothetical protein n=1 Tax=Thermotoga sp. Ku-13t TaxID=1755813 RepID=UPI0013ED3DC0|nr:hypothetical protein [Thermotoga sp. Ku-13t]